MLGFAASFNANGVGNAAIFDELRQVLLSVAGRLSLQYRLAQANYRSCCSNGFGQSGHLIQDSSSRSYTTSGLVGPVDISVYYGPVVSIGELGPLCSAAFTPGGPRPETFVAYAQDTLGQSMLSLMPQRPIAGAVVERGMQGRRRAQAGAGASGLGDFETPTHQSLDELKAELNRQPDGRSYWD